MNFFHSSFINESRFILTDFNCASFDQRLGTGNYYKIIWAREKDVMIAIDGYHLVIKKNHIIFCTPENRLNIEPYTQGAISYIFNKEFYCIRDHDNEVSCNGYLFFGSSAPPIIKLTEKEGKSFNLLFMFFEEEFDNKDHIQGEMLMVLLKRLLIMSTRIAKKNLPKPELPNHKMDLIREFNLLVEKHFRKKHKVVDYAELLHKSPKTLSNTFLKYYNKSPLQIINERIVLEAKRLLMYSDKKTQEISYNLGYSEIGHFSKFFKKHTGQTPKKYKDLHQ
ncbi:MAG: AraC family transcriptional regulator [Flavobacteriaceae bacterium]|nr:AraC family transcriptional regulator [Flavobacteriaceae bacterium]